MEVINFPESMCEKDPTFWRFRFIKESAGDFCACENLEFLFGRNTFEPAVTYEKGCFREFHARENGLLTPMHILHFKLFSGWYATVWQGKAYAIGVPKIWLMSFPCFRSQAATSPTAGAGRERNVNPIEGLSRKWKWNLIYNSYTYNMNVYHIICGIA